MIAQHRAYLSFGPYRDTLAGIRASLEISDRIVKLTGGPGTGKSALCEELGRQLEAAGFEVLPLARPPATAEDLETLLRRRFSLDGNASLHRALSGYLGRWKPARRLVLILDEAQDCGDELLQSLHLLAGVQDDSRRLVRLVLAGSPALDQRLAEPVCRSILQHLGQSYELAPLTRAQTEEFCHLLMVQAGLERHGLEGKAVSLLHRLSRGYPYSLAGMWNDLMAFREILPPSIGAGSIRALVKEPEDAPLSLDPSILAISLGGVLLAAALGFWTVAYLGDASGQVSPALETALAEPVWEELVFEQPAAAPVAVAVAPISASVEESIPAPAEAATASPDEALAAFVRDWLDAWQRQDLKTYLSHYHAEFSSLSHDSRQAWREDRAARLSAPASISLAFDRFEVLRLEEDGATVRFWMTYDSPGYADETWKELRLRLEDGRWTILSERSLETHVL